MLILKIHALDSVFSEGGHMRFFFMTALLLFLLFAPIVASSDSVSTDTSSNGEEFAPLYLGSVAPEFSEKDLYGRQIITLSKYRGKVVMINFWATWCPPCREEIPALEALQSAHKNDLVIIGASVFSSNSATELFYWEYKINYPIIYGSYDLMGRYGKVTAVPTTFLIGKDGKIAARVIGSRTEAGYERMLEPLLSQ
jgi:thiol-disulfide isomerase/thioredoxin